MTPQEIARVIVDALARIAPEVDADSIDPRASFRDQLDIDSMDFLNLVLAIHERLGIDIPEADYPKLSSLNAAVAYLSARTAATPRSLG